MISPGRPVRVRARRFAVAALVLAAACGEDDFEDVETEDATNAGAADATGAMHVSEVRAQGTTPFVELINHSDAPVDIDNWYVSFGRRRVRIDVAGGHPSVVQPGGLALLLDADTDADAFPAWLPVLIPTRDLAGLLASKKIVVRDRGMVVHDRADATSPAADAGISVERRADGKFALSERGATPGERNANAPAGSITTFFANPPEDREDPIAPQLIALIDGAGETLDGAFYQIDHPGIIDAFIRAEQRGVRVRIVTDTRYFTDAAYTAGYQRMIDGGVEVKDDRRSGRMHDKFLVLDGREVFTGSYNLLGDDGPRFMHLDNAVLIRSRAFAQIHTIEFEEMFGGKFGPWKTDNTAHEVSIDGARIEVYFAPTDKPKDAILRELRRAEDSIYFATFSFYQTDMADAMIERFRAGVEVRGTTDDTGGGVDSQLPKMVAAGIDARRPIIDLYIHHKFIVVNYGSADPVVITGSYNFSDKADKTNDEAVYVIHDRAVADAYYRIYRSIYDAAAGQNTDTTNQAELAVSEVFTADSSATAAPFIEIQNLGGQSVPLTGLSITDRDGAPVAVAPLSDKGSLAAGSRAVLRPGSAFRLEAADPLLILDARRRVVGTFDAPRYAGHGKSLTRDDMTVADPDATFTATAPTPGH